MPLVTPELVGKAYQALASGDIEQIKEYWAEDMNWLVPGHNALSGWYHGRDAFLGFMGEVGALSNNSFNMESIAVMTSFLAREVFVSSMAVVIGAGEGVEGNTLLGRVRAARRDDGSPLLSPAAAAGLLVFYVLAMQCLPTLAVTRRETGSWKWAALQLGYMSSVAWVLALVTFHGLHALGVG